MTYKETIDFMYSQLPMFHRVGKAAYKNNLDNAQALDKLCNYPHRSYRTIHVAGTNGKGSVSHMLASILQTAGYKTGLFTSPHLIDFRERIRVNGKVIPEHVVVEFISSFKESFQEIKPSFFEMTSALAFYYFEREKVDIAVIETGLGGRLDSTNIISPVLSVITNIGFDHVEILGDTYAKIAAEKAGIIKPQIPVVVGETHSETAPVFIDTANKNHSEIIFADQIYSASYLEADIKTQTLKIKHTNSEAFDLKLDLLGQYQLKNVGTVLTALDSLSRSGVAIKAEDIKSGLANVSMNTGLMGRWQIISENPYIICDTGHNYDGISYVVSQIKQVKYEKLHFVFGVVNDKDISKILPLLPRDAEYYFTKANIPRALNENELGTLANSVGLRGKTFENVKKAIENAKKNAAPNDLIFIGGSTFIVADALKEIEKN
jgi:dihydrofolate synthase/folylpolyglutamate synthase